MGVPISCEAITIHFRKHITTLDQSTVCQVPLGTRRFGLGDLGWELLEQIKTYNKNRVGVWSCWGTPSRKVLTSWLRHCWRLGNYQASQILKVPGFTNQLAGTHKWSSWRHESSGWSTLRLLHVSESFDMSQAGFQNAFSNFILTSEARQKMSWESRGQNQRCWR